MGVFEMLLLGPGYARAIEAEAKAAYLDNVNNQTIEAVYARWRGAHGEVVRLQAIVEVLLKLCTESGITDATIEYEVGRALQPPQEATGPTTGGPYREEATPVETTPCVKCGKPVPVDRTNITAIGPVCDQCFVKMG